MSISAQRLQASGERKRADISDEKSLGSLEREDAVVRDERSLGLLEREPAQAFDPRLLTSLEKFTDTHDEKKLETKQQDIPTNVIYHVPSLKQGQYALHKGVAVFGDQVLKLKDSSNREIYSTDQNMRWSYIKWIISFDNGLVIFGNENVTQAYDTKEKKPTDLGAHIEEVTVLNKDELVFLKRGKFSIYNINTRQLKENDSFKMERYKKPNKGGLGVAQGSATLGNNHFLINYMLGFVIYQWTGTAFKEISLKRYEGGADVSAPIDPHNRITVRASLGQWTIHPDRNGSFSIHSEFSGDQVDAPVSRVAEPNPLQRSLELKDEPIVHPVGQMREGMRPRQQRGTPPELLSVREELDVQRALLSSLQVRESKSFFATALSFIPSCRRRRDDSEESLCQRATSSCRKAKAD